MAKKGNPCHIRAIMMAPSAVELLASQGKYSWRIPMRTSRSLITPLLPSYIHRHISAVITLGVTQGMRIRARARAEIEEKIVELQGGKEGGRQV